MAVKKNSGTKLYFSQFGGEQPIPPEFLAAMERREEVQSVDNEVGPEALSDEIIESKVETNRTDERVRRTVKKKKGNITLRNIRTNDQGQPVQVTRVLHLTGSLLDVPTATTKVAIADLGNGWSIQESSVEGTYVDGDFVPGIFAGERFERERPDVRPAKFRALIQDVSFDETVEGVAEDPTLDTGDLDKSEEQTDEFSKRIHVKTRGEVELPVTITGKETNQEKQVVSVTETLEDEATTPTLPSELRDVTFEKLGDGTAVETIRSIFSVFGREVFSTEVPDVVPEKFRVAVPIQTTESTTTGNAASPSLSSGDLSKSEQQLTAFTKRLVNRFRSLVGLPVSLVGKDTNQQKQVVTITETLKTAGSDATPTALKDVTVQNLGDGTVLQTQRDVPGVFDGKIYTVLKPNPIPERFRANDALVRSVTRSAATSISIPTLAANEFQKTVAREDEFTIRTEVETLDVEALPTLSGQSFNDAYDLVLPYTEQVTESGEALGDARTEVTPLSEDFDLVKVYTIPTDALDAFGFALPVLFNLGQLPLSLNALQIYWEIAEGVGTGSDTGVAAGSGGTWKIGLNRVNSNQGSASVVPELSPDYHDNGDGNAIPGIDYFFFIEDPTLANVLSKLAARVGDTVTKWPTFHADRHDFVLIGQKLSGEAHSRAQLELSENSDGGSGESVSDGGGTSIDVGSVIRTVALPPVLHGSLSVSGSNYETATLNVDSAASIGVYASDTRTISESAIGQVIGPTSLSATDPPAVPSSGFYYNELAIEPEEKFGWFMCHARVFNAADV